jgi:hypothetical protein
MQERAVDLNPDAPRPVLSFVRAHDPDPPCDRAVPVDVAALGYQSVPIKADPAMLAYLGSDTFLSSLFIREVKTGAQRKKAAPTGTAFCRSIG